MEAAGFLDLQKKIYEIFELEEGSIKYMKPRIKVNSHLKIGLRKLC